MSRAPAEAQKAAAADRRLKFRALVQSIAAMPDTERAALVSKAGAVLTVEGRPLSPANTMLCLMQSPTVSVVGGFRQWLKAGRCVRKGERGLSIWVPVGGKAADANTGEPGERPGFICGAVFDVSQTCEAGAADAVQTDAVAAPVARQPAYAPAYSTEFTQIGA